MAKGAARERTLGALHQKLTEVFIKVLERYCAKIEAVDRDTLEAEVVDEVFEEFEPNPAMLSAVSKFLKDNEIMYDTEELNQLSSQERRLAELKKKRGGKVVSLADLPKVDHG